MNELEKMRKSRDRFCGGFKFAEDIMKDTQNYLDT